MAKYIYRILSRIITASITIAAISTTAAASLDFGPERLVEAENAVITVPGYAAPSFIQWDGDNLPDLVVGEGGLGIYPGKVRVYINRGSPGEPIFTDFFYAQSQGTDLETPSGG